MTAQEYVLRDAEQSDLDHLPTIEAAGDELFATAGYPEFVGGSTLPRRDAQEAMVAGRLTVAVSAGVPVGFALVDRCGSELELCQISVLPSAGRRGIGSALLRHLLRRASAANEPTMVLNTQADVPWNKPWYERFGFVVVPVDAWTPAMHERTRAQTAQGLRWETRVHMRAPLGHRDGASS